MSPNKKILILVTNHASYPDGTATGLWLSELVHFYDVLGQAGLIIDIASPKGGNIAIDPLSLNAFFSDAAVKKFYGDGKRMSLLKNTQRVADLKATDYACIYFSGGHGTMFDFVNNEAMNELTAALYEQDKIVSAVCHGPCALLNIKLKDGNFLIAGKKVTGFSWLEEILANRSSKVPYNLQKELINRGADYKKALLPFTSFIKTDGNIITGQNPQSVKALAKTVLQALLKKESLLPA